MRLSSSSVLIITCLTCAGLAPNSAGAATHNPPSKIVELASVISTNTGQQSILRPGNTGGEVEALQTKLKKLGYYNNSIDGRYGNNTILAVSNFQQAKGLIADGVFGTTTREKLEATIHKQPSLSFATSSTSNNSIKPNGEQRDFLWWTLVGIGILGVIGALLYLVRWYEKVKKDSNPENRATGTSQEHQTKSVTPSLQELKPKTAEHFNSIALISPPESTTSPPTKFLASETTSRLAKVNIVDELIKDLRNPDPTQRRKAIWDLGQQGDSRAIQPLVELMMNADSQQRSLILAALAEIGNRTLKPMNHALAMSLQDESPQVRQNAIRDLTRIYDSMAQFSQMLSHAVHDPDKEVQATARYALSQMNRIRNLPTQTTENNSEKTEDGGTD